MLQVMDNSADHSLMRPQTSPVDRSTVLAVTFSDPFTV